MKTGLTVKFPNCAGIDIAKNLHYVALKFNDQGEQTVEHFEGFTEDLERMADWRTQNGVEQVAMEATGVYWQCSVLPSTLQPRPKVETMPILAALVPNPVGPLQSDLSQN